MNLLYKIYFPNQDSIHRSVVYPTMCSVRGSLHKDVIYSVRDFIMFSVNYTSGLVESKLRDYEFEN